MTSLRGRWAQGLVPRNFTWIIKDRLAAAERPGGFARNHRRVRRQEELIWLRQNGFSRIISLLDSPHNLQAYEDAGLRAEHLPLGKSDEQAAHLAVIYARIANWLDDPNEKLFLHQEEFGERLLGVLAGYLVYSNLVPDGPQAITITEKLCGRTLEATGREIVSLVIDHGLARPS